MTYLPFFTEGVFLSPGISFAPEIHLFLDGAELP